MKIGILTFHRAFNYGAVLQCYALQSALKKMGHDVVVLDYRQPALEKRYKVFDLILFLKKICKFWQLPQFFKNVKRKQRLKSVYSSFVRRYLNVGDAFSCASKVPLNFDCFVIGSDQLLNTKITNGIDPIYSGNFLPEKKKIGFAISANELSFDEIGKEGLEKILKNFADFSLREQSLSDYCSRFVSRDIPVCVDPTLLTSAEDWNGFESSCEFPVRYIAFYQVRPYNNNPDYLRNKVKKMAESNGLDFVDLSSGIYDIPSWVNCIRKATCVVTSSFHATVFSLIFKKPFYSIALNDGNDGRYIDILEKLKLKRSHVLNVEESFLTLPERPCIDDAKIETISNFSKRFLVSSLMK